MNNIIVFIYWGCLSYAAHAVPCLICPVHTTCCSVSARRHIAWAEQTDPKTNPPLAHATLGRSRSARVPSMSVCLFLCLSASVYLFVCLSRDLDRRRGALEARVGERAGPVVRDVLDLKWQGVEFRGWNRRGGGKSGQERRGKTPAALYSVGWGGTGVQGRGRAHLVREVGSLDGALALEHRRRSSSSSAVRRHGGPNRGAGTGRGLLRRHEGAVQCGEPKGSKAVSSAAQKAASSSPRGNDRAWLRPWGAKPPRAARRAMTREEVRQARWGPAKGAF